MVLFARLFAGLLVVFASVLSLSLASTAAQQDTVCSSFNASSAMQPALNSEPDLAPLLDPDGNCIACDHPKTGPMGLPAEPTPSSGFSFTPADQPAGDQAPSPTGVVTVGSTRDLFDAAFGPPIEQLDADDMPEGSEGYAYTPPPDTGLLFVKVTGDLVGELVLMPESLAWSLDEAIEVLQLFLPSDIAELPQLEQVDDTTYAMSLHSAQLATLEIEQFMWLGNRAGEPGDFSVTLEVSRDGANVFEMRIGIGTVDGRARGAQLQAVESQAPSQNVVGALGMTRAGFDASYGTPIEQLPLGDWPEGSEIFLYPQPATASELEAIYYEGVLDMLLVTAESAWTFDEAIAVLQPFLPADLTELPPLEQIDETTFMLSLHTKEFVTPDNGAWLRETYFGEPGDIHVRLHTEDGVLVHDIEFGIGNLAVALEQEALTDGGAVDTGMSPEAQGFLLTVRAEIDQRWDEMATFQATVEAGTFTESESLLLAEIIVRWMEMDQSLPPAPDAYGDMALQVQQLRHDVADVGSMFAIVLVDPANADMTAPSELLTRIEMTIADLDAQLTALGY